LNSYSIASAARRAFIAHSWDPSSAVGGHTICLICFELRQHAPIRASWCARYTTFAAPGVLVTLPGGINNRGQISGFTLTGLEEPFQGARGFLLARGVMDSFTAVGVPGAPRTLAAGLNDRGQIVGTYENPAAAPIP
jgi:hypothetical protein